MKNTVYLSKALFCLLFLPFFLHAQINPVPVGARAVGMANATVTVQDAWALFNNIGALAPVENMEAFGAYDLRFGVVNFQTFSVGFVSPLSFGGVTGLGLSRFGDEIYSEQKISLGYSHQIELVSLGLKVNLVQVSMQDLGGRSSITFEFGGVAELMPNLVFGAYIYNFSRAGFNAEFGREPIPVMMRAGLSYRPSQKLMLNLETEKDVDLPASFKAGLEYELMDKLVMRTGMQSQPFVNYLGLGFKPRSFRMDYALSNQSRLGLSHTFAFSYTLKTR